MTIPAHWHTEHIHWSKNKNDTHLKGASAPPSHLVTEGRKLAQTHSPRSQPPPKSNLKNSQKMKLHRLRCSTLIVLSLPPPLIWGHIYREAQTEPEAVLITSEHTTSPLTIHSFTSPLIFFESGCKCASRNEVRLLCVCVRVHSTWRKSTFDILFKNTSPLRVVIMWALFISLFWGVTISIRAAAFCCWPDSGSHTHVWANTQPWSLPPLTEDKHSYIRASPISHFWWLLFAVFEGFPATICHIAFNLSWCKNKRK